MIQVIVDDVSQADYLEGFFRKTEGFEQYKCGLFFEFDPEPPIEDTVKAYHKGKKAKVDVKKSVETALADFKYLQGDEVFEAEKFILIRPVADTEKRLEVETELVRRLGIEKCYSINQNEDTYIGLLIAEGKIDEVKSYLENAQPYPIEGIYTVYEAAKNLGNYYQNGLPRGEQLSWKSIRGYYSVRRGEVTLVTGIPGHGKSELVDAITLDLGQRKDWKFGMYTPENFPFEMHAAKLIEKMVGKSFSRWHGETVRMTQKEMLESAAWLNQHYYYILPEKPTIDEILSGARKLVVRNGISGLVIDPWNEIDHSRPEKFSETEYISESLSKVKKFARMNNLHVWFVAHPRKVEKDKSGKRMVPDPYDISGSAHWRNKADNCLTVWREVLQPEDPVEIHIQKIRFKIVGKVGLVKLGYNIISGQYYDLDNAQAEPTRILEEEGPDHDWRDK